MLFHRDLSKNKTRTGPQMFPRSALGVGLPRRFDVLFVPWAHRAERTLVMVREFIVWVAMLRADHARRPRVAS